MRRKYRFSLRLKLVLFITILAMITYGTSAFFIYILYDYVQMFLSIPLHWYTILTLLGGVFWSGLLAFFAAFLITKPLEKLSEIASEAANGNLNQEVPIPSSDDEIRALSVSVHTMLRNLNQIVLNIDKNFQHTNETVLQMKETSNQSAEHSGAIRTAIYEISSGAEQSAEAIQSTAESVEMATDLAVKVQEKAEQSKEKSSTMLQTLKESKLVFHQLVDGINLLATEQVASLKDVEHLKQNAKQVEAIVSMVGEIAGQTNLLALNASIEAARAGEQGRGFSVVAEEIRKLADESAKAVENISSLISSIQHDVQLVVDKINSNVEVAKKESSNGKKTNEAMNQMEQSVNDVAEEIGNISELVDNQLQLIQHTVRQSQEVAAIAEETSAGAEEVNAAVQEQSAIIEKVEQLSYNIEVQAEQLNQQINQFEITKA
ncbi:methyl-accepting chemotaxis protein [Oceanobacillus sp. Castelsardo]|uniref:methyl-accepting chemotaxis protein n=1 Tax=Oceanobacillus sp. Castelsardo TaxID=1851204 RepID=UPI0008384D85|nr:methyl-accepting chemotaxis protein [Oceanobacillus sp. Castelsardo]